MHRLIANIFIAAVIPAIAHAEDAPLLNAGERQKLETLLSHACRNSQAPDLKCSPVAIELFDKMAAARVAAKEERAKH
jgi:hypothetical protein